MTKIRINRNGVCCALLLCVTTVIPSSAQSFTTLLAFNGTNGSVPGYGPLVQGLDGNLYGTTSAGGGDQSEGTVYKMTPSGTLTTLYNFPCQGGRCNNGNTPYAGLVLAPNGSFYGTATKGGVGLHGTVFKITSGGSFTMLHSFAYKQGRSPYAGLVLADDGNFYGTTEQGGAHSSGTVFKITPDGNLTTLYSFCSLTKCADGYKPYAGLVQAPNGNLYGTTVSGGTSETDCGSFGGVFGCGTVFQITPSGTLTTLYSFCSHANCTDGATPFAGLVQASDGNFYGTTVLGGATNNGTIFKITSNGTLTTLYNFCSQSKCTDGLFPYSALIQATDANFYGTTSGGGASDYGTVFKIASSGILTTVHSFNEADGTSPYAGLVQATNGSLYGTTSSGGTAEAGTVYKLSVGLVPFVETLPYSGNVGAAIKILGTKLTGTTAVSFNGIAATFTVVSNTEITTTVPSGSTTGFVTVTTPGGKLKSNKKFRIIG